MDRENLPDNASTLPVSDLERIERNRKTLLRELEETEDCRKRSFGRFLLGIGGSEWFFILIEAGILGILLWHKFRDQGWHPIAVALLLVWAILHWMGLFKRWKTERNYRIRYCAAMNALRGGKIEEAAPLLEEALEAAGSYHGWIALIHCKGLLGQTADAVHAARKLYHLHVRRNPEVLNEDPSLILLLEDPSLKTIRPRLMEILNGEPREVLHYLPGLVRDRLVQTILAVLYVTAAAAAITSVLTFL